MALDPITNFAKATLTAGIDIDDTSFSVTAGQGALFPDPSTDGAFNVVIYNATDYPDPADDPNVEIVRCTARSTDTLTVTRAQEGTPGATHNTGGKTYKMILGFTKKMKDDVETLVGEKLALAGGTMSGDIQLGETDIKLDAVLSGDETWSGIVMSGTAGAQLVVGEICYLASSGKWLKVDGILDGTDTGFSKELGMCVLAASGDTEPTEILKYGKIRSAKFPALTVGSPAYLSDTAGEIVVAQPSTANFAIRVVGIAITAEDLLFNPSNDYIVHT
jgi:hypothetical protein